MYDKAVEVAMRQLVGQVNQFFKACFGGVSPCHFDWPISCSLHVPRSNRGFFPTSCIHKAPSSEYDDCDQRLSVHYYECDLIPLDDPHHNGALAIDSFHHYYHHSRHYHLSSPCTTTTVIAYTSFYISSKGKIWEYGKYRPV
jgi:hypothetical protein